MERAPLSEHGEPLKMVRNLRGDIGAVVKGSEPRVTPDDFFFLSLNGTLLLATPKGTLHYKKAGDKRGNVY